MGEQVRYHDEVAQGLKAIGNPALGEAIRRDRDSELEHLGIRFPALRKRVKEGFSFYALPDDEVLRTWDALWRTSPYGDVLFAALEYYLPIARSRPSAGLWFVVKGWVERVDNWCHSDVLSSLFAHLLEGFPEHVYPQLQEWNAAEDQWLRRISIVSLIPSGRKQGGWLPPEQVLSLVENTVGDHRYYVELAAGWVLRELARAHLDETTAFLERHASTMSARAQSRAIEHRRAEERVRLRALRKEKP